VTVLDTLPVTHVGKPFKPSLRAQAAREAIAHALQGMPQITAVRGLVEDGAVVVVVELDPGIDQTSVTTSIRESLDRFALTCRLEPS
jgi:fatty-acyl-CoA synthase